MNPVRHAVVNTATLSEPSALDVKERVDRFLPHNFASVWAGDGVLHIVGVDDHGWTLTDYVIPRLASGLITATEVTS